MREIKNCYDSHTHFVATGQIALGFKLQDLSSAEDLKNKKINPEYFQGHWLVGFGWNHLLWKNPVLPSQTLLDQCFPDFPVLLSRVDGHASWINSWAEKELGLKSQNGILLEQDHILALQKLPPFSDEQLKAQIKESIKIFNQAGFTHVRDLSMSFRTAQGLQEIFESGKLTLCIEGFVTAENINDLDRALDDLQKCKQLKNPFLRFPGLKIFVDGSLGSETAWLSGPYKNTQNSGHTAWSSDGVKKALRFSWTRKLDLAVHVIGDRAVEMVVQAAREVSAEGILGQLHLEHVQLVQPSTVQKMKPLHIRCHMQPCHWLSDKVWLNSKIGDLSKYLFQWELLRKNKIPVSWGSDSPIEPASLIRNLAALKDSSLHGIPALGIDGEEFHAHPDTFWTSSKTTYNEDQILEVIFDGKKII